MWVVDTRACTHPPVHVLQQGHSVGLLCSRSSWLRVTRWILVVHYHRMVLVFAAHMCIPAHRAWAQRALRGSCWVVARCQLWLLHLLCKAKVPSLAGCLCLSAAEVDPLCMWADLPACSCLLLSAWHLEATFSRSGRPAPCPRSVQGRQPISHSAVFAAGCVCLGVMLCLPSTASGVRCHERFAACRYAGACCGSITRPCLATEPFGRVVVLALALSCHSAWASAFSMFQQWLTSEHVAVSVADPVVCWSYRRVPLLFVGCWGVCGCGRGECYCCAHLRQLVLLARACPALV